MREGGEKKRKEKKTKRKIHPPTQVRTFYGVDLNGLQYKDLDGMNLVPPAQDLSGQWWDEEKGVLK